MGGTWSGANEELATELRGAASRDLGNPLLGLAALQFEGFAGTRTGELDGGVRARLMFPFARAGVGVDRNVVDARTRWFVSLVHPGRRGGLFGDGSVLRLDVSPGRDLSVALGLEKPIQRRVPPGRARPRYDHVRLSAARVPSASVPNVPAVRDALAEARERAEWIGTVTVPWLDHASADRVRAEAAVLAQIASLRRALSPVGGDGVETPRRMDDEVRAFHAAVERAFAGALTDDPVLAAEVAAMARTVLLDEVLLPYDRLLGQVKREDTTREFARRARGMFLHWLHVESRVPRAHIPDVLGVFVGLLDIVEENRARIRAAWKDSRFVWLPLQYALRPEEHDTQAELDALLERATGERFTDGNTVSYVINEQAQYQFSRMIRAAREYHVLWIHDVRGVDDGGDPDEQSYRHVVGSYLRAMTERVRAYDSTGTFPSYMILLDHWFYALRGSRLWMSLLEDPLRHEVRLPRSHRAWADTLRAVQDSLRAAVAGSALLQAQRAQYGDRWLYDLVKVHVNITNAAEWTFWSRRLMRGMSVPDNMLRDHRKLSFYDISEEDPYRGEAMFTGAGLGENYSNLSWEDRSILVRGPSALTLKSAARQVLLDHGLPPERIPWALQPRERAADYDARVRAVTEGGGRTLRAMSVHNVTGYGDKEVNVAKAVLYTLMPAGSVIKVPDSLWNSAFWGAALAGCALRGGRVLVIIPAVENTPVPAFGSLEHAHGVAWRLLAVSRVLAPELAARGGLLRVGIYTSSLEVTDIPGKLQAVQATFAEHAWLRELYGFPEAVYAGLADMVDRFRGISMLPVVREDFESERTPKLHLKANVMASPEAWSVMARPEWEAMTWEFITQRIAQVQMRANAVKSFDNFPDATVDVGDGNMQAWFESLAAADRARVVFYTIIGSHNQNARSMVTDGEDAFVVSAWPSVIPYLDLIALVGQSRWPEDPSELAELLPPQSPFKTRLSHWARLAF